MYSFYYNDIQTFRSLNQRCIISNKIITDLLSKLHAKSHAPKKTEQPLVFDVDNIKKALLEVLQTIPHSPHNYFSKYYNRLFFEIIFEIYHYAQIELQKSQERTSIKDSINQIAAFKNSVVDSSSIEQDISRKKKILVNDFNILQTQSTYSSKLSNFYSYMGLKCDDKPTVSPIITPENTVFILRSYSDSIFNQKNSKDGILLHTVNRILKDYLDCFGDQNTFKVEYCIYEFNKIYNYIQYSECCSSYLNQTFTHKKIPTDYSPLCMYTKLFDTQYLSLIDFIFEMQKENLGNIYNDPSILHDALLKKELLNTFWLPIINLCLKETVFLCSKGYFDTICQTCKEWLIDQIEHNDYSYFSLMHKTQENLANSTYPNEKDYNRRKDIKDIKHTKTGSPNQVFNITFSKAFFYNDLPNYLYTYPDQIKYLDQCLSFIEDIYKQRNDTYKDLSLKTCTDYINSIH